MNLFPAVAKGNVENLYANADRRHQALAEDVGLHNVLGYEAAFATDPLAMDFLRPESPYYFLKLLSTEIYQDILGDCLDTIAPSAHALDAGCGIGRFTWPLADRAARVTAIDPCRSALQAAHRHLTESGRNNVDLVWADRSLLADLPPASFHVLWAVEWLCYMADPEAAMADLGRLAAPGALLVVSVESLPGALLGVDLPGPQAAVKALGGEPLLIPGDRYVRYFTPDDLTRLVSAAGFEITDSFDSPFFAEGPMWQAIDDEQLADPEYRQAIREAEAACRREPSRRGLARATGIIGRKA